MAAELNVEGILRVKKLISIILILCFFSQIFSQTVIEIEPFTEDNIPSWAHDARRMSIVTLGSVPFTTLSATLGYSVFRYIANDFDSDYIPNPFPTSSTAAKINKDEQIGILVAASVLSLAIGITDLIVVKVKENNKEKELQKEQADRVIITPLSTEGNETE